MNKRQRQEYSDLYAAQSKRIERKFLGPVFRALEWQVDQALAIIREVGPERARNEIDFQVFNSKIEPVLNDLHIVSGLFFANKGLREINKAVRLRTKAANFGYNDEWRELINAYFRRFMLSKSTIPIGLNTRDQILAMLDVAFREGWGYEKISEAFVNEKGILLWRARRIVRTENQFASNYGRVLAAEKSEYQTGKEWIAANDHRTRTSHRRVDGEVIDEDARFQVDIIKRKTVVGVDMMTGPGDPDADAVNVINCRCTCALVPIRDERGQLIPKQQLATV